MFDDSYRHVVWKPNQTISDKQELVITEGSYDNIETIKPYVDDFIEFAQKHNVLLFFWVTEMDYDIAFTP